MYQKSDMDASMDNKQVCSTWGNYHFKKFDGDIFHLPSTCNYIMCAMCGSTYEDFNIQLRRKGVNNQPTITNITMKLNSTVVELTKNSVRINGSLMTLPFSHSGVLIDKNSSYIKVTAKLGLVAKWNEDDSFTPVNWTCATAPTGPDPFVFAEPSQNTLANVNKQVESLTRGGLSSSVDYCGHANASATFSVLTENIPCGTTGTTCSKAVRVFLGNKEIKLTDAGYQILHRDEGVDIPYQIWIRGIYMVIEANNGLIVIWDQRKNIFVKLSPNFKGTVCGLCGNYDGNANNEFMLRSQEVH
ncbi:unnamed protein product [Leuciscus chuanchicus]